LFQLVVLGLNSSMNSINCCNSSSLNSIFLKCFPIACLIFIAEGNMNVLITLPFNLFLDWVVEFDDTL
jgi:type III secretory pathway component EscT